MASYDGNIVRQLGKHTECSICLTTLTDPRILPCVHTFCLKCLENTAACTNKRPGDNMPCPHCRRMFTIPSNGFRGLMINFDMHSLIRMVADAILMFSPTSVCDRHETKPLEIFCLECEEPVCFSCLIDNHQGHKASDIVEVKERFSLELDDYMKQILSYKDLMKEQDEKKKRYLSEIDEKENAILRRSKELIERIKRDTKSLLKELSSLSAKHLAEMEKEREELEKQCVIMEKYRTIYETEARLQTLAKASLADICDTKKKLQVLFEKLNECLKLSKVSSYEVLLQLQDQIEIDLESEVNNVVGKIKGTTKVDSELIALKEKKVFVVGSRDGHNTMFEFNLRHPSELSEFQPVPTRTNSEAVAVSFGDKLFVVGIGDKFNEIWKFERISGWKKCANLNQAREGFCASVVDTLIYIYGGHHPFSGQYLRGVEAYDLQTNKCSTVGELVHAVWMPASVAYKGLIYIFGGLSEEDNEETNDKTDCVQIFHSIDNTCSLSSKPMPSPQVHLRALLWNNSAILINDETCFMFDFETEIWTERKRFKSDVFYFGLVHDDEKVYVFGDIGGFTTRCRDEIKCFRLDDIITGENVEWQLHGRLPKGIEMHTYA